MPVKKGLKKSATPMSKAGVAKKKRLKEAVKQAFGQE